VVRPDGVNPGRSGAPDFASAVQVDRDDLAGRPVGKPEPALVPAGRLDHGKAVQEHLRLTWENHVDHTSRVHAHHKTTWPAPNHREPLAPEPVQCAAAHSVPSRAYLALRSLRGEAAYRQVRTPLEHPSRYVMLARYSQHARSPVWAAIPVRWVSVLVAPDCQSALAASGLRWSASVGWMVGGPGSG
jgi:hypothetical protein